MKGEVNYKLIFNTFEEGMEVHKKLYQMMREKGYITYEELIRMYGDGGHCKQWMQNVGWTNLWGTKVEPYGDDGLWVLVMPEIKRIDIKKESK